MSVGKHARWAGAKRHVREGRVSGPQVAFLTFVIAILLAPLALISLMSFNESPLGTFPFSGTLQWYRVLFAEGALFRATLLSLELAGLVALMCGVLGSMLAIWIVRYARGFGQVLVNAMLLAGVTIPWLVLGVAMLLVLNAIGIGRSYVGLFFGDAAVALPYTVFIIVARLRGMDPSIEEAARSLGATPITTFVRVLVPIIAPAVIAGMLMAFVICFNNFVIQYFLAPFGVQTLPIDIYGLIRIGYKPDINALATIIMLVTIIPVLVLQRLVYVRGTPSARERKA